MNDDFNSPVLIAELFEAVRIINSVYDGKLKLKQEDIDALVQLVNSFVFEVLGLNYDDQQSNDLGGLMDLLIQIRTEAKQNQDYATSDKIRMALDSLGIQLKDSKEGTTWTKA
jgi:cysteinyl-tRNA synthetase